MLILLAILIFIYNFAAALIVMAGSEPSAEARFVYLAGFICGSIWWLRSDKHRSAVTPLYCQGLLVYVGWVVIIPYHLIKTRGAKGLLPLLLLAGSFVSAPVAALVVYLVVFGSPPGY